MEQTNRAPFSSIEKNMSLEERLTGIKNCLGFLADEINEFGEKNLFKMLKKAEFEVFLRIEEIRDINKIYMQNINGKNKS